ncbi:MAG: lamin tail domain-containing protein [Balneolaceae bacterium]|nr:lamin tail domain-containing protein [Balneolaceae bacterium]
MNFEDGFEDGDFTSNPIWSGDDGQYTVINGTPNFLLQLQGDDVNGGVSSLSTPSTNTEGAWEFYINLDFSPSGGNQAHIFLMSDIADLEGSVNGYAVQAGEGGSSDVFRIVRYDNGSQLSTPVLSGTTDISSGGQFRVRVTRQSGGIWTLEVGEGYDGAPSQEGGTTTDNTYTTSNFFGVRSTYTSSRADLFTYDFKIDLPPFTIDGATSVSNSEIDVTFNQDYDQTTVQPSDFSVNNNGGSPASVTFPSPTVVRLTYGSSLPSDEYTMTAQNIQAQNGKSIASDASANFIIFADYTPGDVIINEFMYDPPSGQEEYIEIKNLSGKYLNLQDWQIGDESGNGTISSGTVILQPNDFIAVSSDTTALFNVYGSRPYVESGSIPSLNNGGDVVKILTDGGAVADSLQYTPAWGGDNIAVERRSDTAPSTYMENFGDSPSINGGTPGIANEIADDTTPPDLNNLIITNSQTLDLDFSERLESTSATNAGNYTLNNGISINNAQQTAADSVQLSLSSPLQNGTEYELTISNQQDIFGNTATPIDTSFTYYFVTAVDSGDIFINEFMYDPPDGSSEYIELRNPTSESFDLNGWTINDNTGTPQTIANSQFIVPPDSFVVIAPDQTLLQDNPNIALVDMGSGFPSLNNSGDAIVLRDDNGERLDSLIYNSDWGGNQVALERRTTEVKPIEANFGNAPNGFGTPGQANQVPSDEAPPALQTFSILSNQSLELVFTEQVDSHTASDPSNYAMTGGLTISSATASADTVQITLSGSLQNNTQYTATVDGVTDLFGNALTDRDTTFTYFEVSPADSGDIFINEFTYDPPEGSTEYIELYNSSSKSLDLQNWTINDNTGNRKIITEGQFIVPPDSFVVIAPDNTLLQNNPDITLVAVGNRFPSLNNSGDDIVLRDKTGERLDSLSYNADWGGDQVALERRTTEVKPIEANFGNAPNGFGTPGNQNEISPDTTPPNLAAFSIIDSQSLEFVFTEQIEESSATNTENYTLSGGIPVNSAIVAGGDTVRIGLAEAMQNNTSYTATINKVNDIFSNTLTNRDTTFTYFEISPVDSGDIFINEFMYDPPSGQTEYIELYNPSSRSLNIQNWTVNDNTGNRRIITEEQFIVPPDSFVVVAPDPTLRDNYPDVALITMGSRFPSLNNSGDNIILRDQNGTLLDSLRYTSNWGGNEVALERRTTNIAPIGANFGDAPNEFGTPGSTNQVTPDNEPPILNSLRILDETTLQLIFSETISGQTATDQDNYSIVPNPGIQLISSVQDTVTLFLSNKLQSDQAYQITVRELQDVFGNIIIEATREITYLSFTEAQPGNIIINEILYSREGAGSPEFVELLNRTNQNFDLSNWKLGDASSTATLDAGVQLRAGEYLVITDNASLANVVDNGIFLSDFPSLNDDEDAVYIQSDNATTIDSLFYTTEFGGSTDGKSTERKDPGAASNDAANFATSTANNGSTPGLQNSVFGLDETPPTIVFSRIFPNGDIEVRFSEFIAITPDLTFSTGDQALNIDEFDPANGNIIFLNSSPDPASTAPVAAAETRTSLTITAENLSDVKGNVNPSVQQPVSQPLLAGDVVINEILFDPLSDSEDNQPDQAEYLELRNIRDYAISLENITLHDAPDEDGNVRTLTPVNTTSKFIPAQGTALIYAEDENPAFNQSKVAQFFDLQDPAPSSIIRVDRSSLSLASTDDAIFLTGDEGTEIDSVYFDESWHNPNLVDTDGVALERINPFGPSNNNTNWGSSTNEKGGTPNQENTLFQTPGNGGQQEVGISFMPNPFSPDDDGIDDNLFINYQLDQPDYLMTVRIYDRYGRLVRELADSKQAGLQGSLIWDGRKDNGTYNRIGIYIVIFKAFDSASGDNKTFKETVVLARRLN